MLSKSTNVDEHIKTFLLTGFIPTYPVNLIGVPGKIHDFQQSVDGLISHESIARIEPTI
jgi:hypothetical protein